MRMVSIIVACLAIGGIERSLAAEPTYSALWGKNGEAWSPDSRLPDFSFAGYRCGEKAIPQVKVVANVRDFGAKGDGKTDDTDAFRKAIDSTKEGGILIPKGEYLLSDILWIKLPNVVLRGEGPENTILHFTKELEDVRPNMGKTTGGRPTSNYSWSGGFIWFTGKTESKVLSTIVSEATRGATGLTLDKSADVKVGDWVMVQMTDDGEKSLLTHIYSGDPGDVSKITKPIVIDFASRVSDVSGKQVTLERPLRWDVRKGWNPVLKSFRPTVIESGIEELAISFPVKPYKGHFTERGMNGIAMNGVANCWVKNVTISNCDSGIFIGGRFCTVDGLKIDGTRNASRGDAGHHGITLGHDGLITNFDVQAKFIHDVTFTNLQSGNVVKNGRGRNVSFDHHKRGPYENLICNVDVGDGGQVWRCGGGGSLGKNCGARGTFWCIRAKKDMPPPPKGFGPASLNVVGLRTASKSTTTPKERWVESIPPEDLYPKDLHAAQLERRLKSRSPKPDAANDK